MPNRKVSITDEQRAEAIRRYQAGEGSTTIAADLGCSPKTILDKVLRPAGVEITLGGRKLTPAQRNEVAKRYAAGESLRQLAKAFDCSPPNIKWLIQHRGIQVRPTGRPPASPEMLELIRARRTEGASHRMIAKELGRSERWVVQQCREMALPVEPMPSGSEHHAWKGGRTVHRGYVLVWIDPADPLVSMSNSTTGYVPEHRLVMARTLGRPLTRRETVHHINGDKSDNRIENLQLRQGNHGTGVRMTCLDCGSHNIGAAPL